jgi:hypothetical protein
MPYVPAEDRYERMVYTTVRMKPSAVSLGFCITLVIMTPRMTPSAILQTASDHGIAAFDLANNPGLRRRIGGHALDRS